jgi:hypothetical protein
VRTSAAFMTPSAEQVLHGHRGNADTMAKLAGNGVRHDAIVQNFDGMKSK